MPDSWSLHGRLRAPRDWGSRAIAIPVKVISSYLSTDPRPVIIAYWAGLSRNRWQVGGYDGAWDEALDESCIQSWMFARGEGASMTHTWFSVLMWWVRAPSAQAESQTA